MSGDTPSSSDLWSRGAICSDVIFEYAKCSNVVIYLHDIHVDFVSSVCFFFLNLFYSVYIEFVTHCLKTTRLHVTTYVYIYMCFMAAPGEFAIDNSGIS